MVLEGLVRGAGVELAVVVTGWLEKDTQKAAV
jgi:hypothetical protein